MHRVRYLLIFTGFLFVHLVCRGQQTDSVQHLFSPADSVQHSKHVKSPYAPDSLAKKKHDPRKATVRSAMIPGWGQIYNHKYWKLPLVYAAVGIPVYTFIYNRTWFNNFNKAIALVDYYNSVDSPAVPASIVAKLPTNIQYLVTLGYGQENALRTYRNQYRQDEDYSILIFLLAWGLNVVDATVDAHLMYFDVSDNLSMNLQAPSPGFLPPGSSPAGISLVFELHKPRYRPLTLQ
jgi:Family of unknown function (DUF5683)